MLRTISNPNSQFYKKAVNVMFESANRMYQLPALSVLPMCYSFPVVDANIVNAYTAHSSQFSSYDTKIIDFLTTSMREYTV